jgi:hypothetical protein
MIKKIIISLTALSSLALLLFIITPGIVAAFNPEAIMTQIMELAQTLFAMLVVVFIIVGAFFFVTAAGDDKKIEKGRKAIMFAIIGAVLVAISQGIIAWLTGLMQAT